MSDLEEAIAACKKYETVLERKYGATGKGLHEKATAVQASLNDTTLRYLRLVATARNRIVHEDDVTQIGNRPQFDEARRYLDAHLCSAESRASALPLGAPEYARYAKYRGFGTDDAHALLSCGFRQLVACWETASGLRFADTSACREDVAYWVMFVVTDYVNKLIARLAPELAFEMAVGRPGAAFVLHPHTTPPSPACRKLRATLAAHARKDFLVYRRTDIGIDSQHHEAILLRQRGIEIQDGFLGMRRLKPVQDRSLVSLT